MLTLGQRSRLSFAFEPPIMRLTDNALRSVVFLGHVLDPDDLETFKARATGFFVGFKGVAYLVTAAHVAVGLGADPFYVRINSLKDDCGAVIVDPGADEMHRWFLHPDPSVDLALIAFPYRFRDAGWDQLAIGGDLLMSAAGVVEHDVGPGDTCYAVGLFRLLQGRRRNLAVVHQGSIAAMPSDELIPVSNWRGDGKVQARAYLVEATNLKGLSGSPVFVRPTIQIMADRMSVQHEEAGISFSRGGNAGLSAPSCDVYLLGVWSASWDAQPDEVLGLDHGTETRVPLGLGVVVPTSALLDLLDSELVKVQRRNLYETYSPELANPDEG